MATIPNKIIKVETPVSESDSNYEQFEFMLAWYGRDGSFYQYLFTDWRNRKETESTSVNLKDKDKLSSIIASDRREVRLVAEELTLNDLEVISSIMEAKTILRLFKDGTSERLGKPSNSLDYLQSDGRYNFTFDLALYEKPLPR